MTIARISLAFAAITLAVPASAQAQDHDPTNAVKGGELPSGWTLRFDPSRAGRPAPKPSDVNFRTMGSGLHLTSGPAALYYRPADKMSGNYSVSATISQAKSMGHEAYGLFVGGNNLKTPEENYVYMVMRPKDGKFLINHRTSDAKPTNLVPYTTNAAIHAEDAETGKASNKFEIRVEGKMIHFLINGTEVKVLDASKIPDFSTDGVVGLRLNHNLDVHIAGYAVEK